MINNAEHPKLDALFCLQKELEINTTALKGGDLYAFDSNHNRNRNSNPLSSKSAEHLFDAPTLIKKGRHMTHDEVFGSLRRMLNS